MSSNDWPQIKIGEMIRRGVLAMNDGYRVRNVELGPIGIPFVRGGDIGYGEINTTVADHIRPEFIDRVQSKLTRPYDVAFITKGTVGRVGMIRPGQPPSVFAPQVCYWRSLDLEQLDPRFLFYLLTSAEFQSNLDAVKTHGSMVADYVSMTDQRDFRLTFPPIREQRAIAAVLGALDDKIELNRRMNATLESMARALFQSWFVDFDPVRAKLDGHHLESLDPITAALFPDSFQDSLLGQIPKGWEVKTADEVSTVGIGKTPPRMELHWFTESPADIPWMSIRDLGAAGVFISHTSEFLTEEAVEKFRVRRIPDNTVVLSFKLTMGRVAITDGEMLSNEAIAHFRLNPETTFGSEFLYCYLKGFGYDQLGSTSSIATAINSDMVREMRILVPPNRLAEAFEHTVKPLFTQMKNIQKQSRTLATLRDTLLPKLLSGAFSANIMFEAEGLGNE
jgi:type I restriction enzyme S subunit